MAQTVVLKRSAVQGKVPTTTDLELGELAVNTFDGKLYFEKDDGTASIVTVANTTDLAGKQDTLISGTNIKTINGSTILGSGNIAINNLTSPTITGAILNAGYTESVYAIGGSTPALSPANGSIQTWILQNGSTPTIGTWASGQSLTLMIDDGSAYTVNWTSMAITWETDSASAPTLSTAGYTVIQLWKVGTVIYGARVGNA